MAIQKARLRHFGRLASAVVLATASTLAQETNSTGGGFQLFSTAFANNRFLPISAIHNMVVNNINVCSIDGSPGGNQSPELSWTGAPPSTRTFVVVVYDATAAFTDWGMSNISGRSAGLPQNAGVVGSPYGAQIFNDFFIGAEYELNST